MATFFENKDRRVIPNFRSLKRTIELGELNAPDNFFIKMTKPSLENYILDFRKNRTLGHASDLISAAIVSNNFDDKNIIDAASFILKRSQQITNLQIEAASKILNPTSPQKSFTTINKIDEFLENNRLTEIYSRINKIKSQIIQFDKNPFLYIELSRLYSIIGRKDKSIKYIKIALQLAPTNRYVLRSFSRLMAHFGDVDQAHGVLRRNVATNFDPWLLASEIAFSSLRKKNSNLLKFGNEIINSKKFHPFSLSELASSIGTVELINGSRKKSRSLFATALKSPNDNSLAQIEWANNKENFFELDFDFFNNSNNYEALTLEGFNTRNWGKSLQNAEKWFIDMPFAKRPVMFGHHVASFFLDDETTGIKFCKAGLISNPNDPQIINNISYSYAMDNDPKNAFSYLGRVNISDVKENSQKICLLATTGLAHYRDDSPEIGRKLYLDAIKEAKQKGLKYYYNLALMNFAREELRINSKESELLFEQVEKIPDNDNIEIKVMKKKLRDIHSKKIPS